MNSIASLEDFPTEIIRHVFLCLERDDWKNVLSVNKAWYAIGNRVFMEVLIYKGTRLLQMKNYKRSLKVINWKIPQKFLIVNYSILTKFCMLSNLSLRKNAKEIRMEP